MERLRRDRGGPVVRSWELGILLGEFYPEFLGFGTAEDRIAVATTARIAAGINRFAFNVVFTSVEFIASLTSVLGRVIDDLV